MANTSQIPDTRRHHPFGLVFVLVVGVAATFTTVYVWAAPIHSNRELARLEAADQADRSQPHAHDQRIDWTAVARRDAGRRTQVLALLAAGEIRTAADFLNAAVIFQHGSTAKDTRLALAFATVAVQLDQLDHKPDSAAMQMMANAWDRTLLKDKQPQWYGTQYVRSNLDGPWRLYKVNPTAITDAQRRKLGLPTIEQAEAAVAALNARQAKLH